VLAGAVFLGFGTRLAMRGVALVEGRMPGWSFGGTMTVVLLGALWGLGAAVVWLLVRRGMPRNRWIRGVAFGVLFTLAVTPGLTPFRVSTLLLFAPWFLLYGIAMSLAAPPPPPTSTISIESREN
jgi:hypothetical protein